MTIELLEQYVFNQWHQTSWLEIIAVLFGILQVLLAYKNNVLLYPAGIISTTIFIWLFANPKTGLYAEASLNLYYLVMSIYGWILWAAKNKKEEHIPISKTTNKEWKIAIVIFLIAYLLLFVVLSKFTNSNVPYMDAFVSAAAWAGMWLLAKRKIENWIVLNISNAVGIPLMFYKSMPLTGLLTLFLFTVAVFGYFNWKRIMKESKDQFHLI